MHSEAVRSPWLRLGPSASVAACGALLAVLSIMSAELLQASRWFPFKAASGYFVAATLVIVCSSRFASQRPFGLANTVTLVRATLTALLMGAAYEIVTSALLWFCVFVATAALVLDGVDGWLARRREEASSFGARFDMETDAALMIVLSLLVWMLDRAGAWVLLAGMLRYVFVALGSVLPLLRRPLPPSTRRKAACIVALVALVVALAPIIPPPLAVATAAAGLGLLIVSFAIDIGWLLRHA